MARAKHARPDEHFLGQIRELKRENKSLKQQLKQLQRREHLVEDLEESIKENEPVEQLPVGKQEKVQCCPKCNKFALKETIVINRLFMECQLCEWRSKAKIIPLPE